MDDKPISIRHAVVRFNDQRCKRADCVFPGPTIGVDLDGHRLVATWSWPDVRVVNVPNGVRVKIVATLMLVPISCN